VIPNFDPVYNKMSTTAILNKYVVKNYSMESRLKVPVLRASKTDEKLSISVNRNDL
jgi:hypothetical protein